MPTGMMGDSPRRLDDPDYGAMARRLMEMLNEPWRFPDRNAYLPNSYPASPPQQRPDMPLAPENIAARSIQRADPGQPPYIGIDRVVPTRPGQGADIRQFVPQYQGPYMPMIQRRPPRSPTSRINEQQWFAPPEPMPRL